MKHLKRIFESKEQELEELEEACIWLSDHVDTLEIESNGEVNGFRNYNIEIAVNYGKTDITEVLEYTEKLTEVIKEYTNLLALLERMGYKVSYHLLQTTIHLDFSRLNGKIQLEKAI
jgi:hypothetical protein